MTLRRAATNAAIALAAALGVCTSAAAVQSVAVAVHGTSLVLRTTDSKLLTEATLAGQAFELGGLALRITAVERDSARPSVWLHTLEAQGADGRWVSVCTPDREGRQLALFIGGHTTPDGRHVPDAARVSVTCSSGAEGKCLRAGYLPDNPAGQARFQACTRMFRADYCGDGTAWTVDGMAIDLYDRDGIQQPGNDPSLVFEAAWGTGGAVCVHHTRVPARIELGELLQRCPRLVVQSGSACTEPAASVLPGALLFNRSVHTGPASAGRGKP